MRGLRFWKRESTTEAEVDAPPATSKFGIPPRGDLGPPDLPDDPDIAAKATALHRSREALANELRVAEVAGEPDNQWRHEIGLISEALESIDRERSALGDTRPPVGQPLPPVPVTGISVDLEPAPTVSFQIGDIAFAYAEELDWAERGTQVALSDLYRERGDIAALLPRGFPPDQRPAVVEHLEGSLFTFATDLRDRALNGAVMPQTTLADLAAPSAEFGAWLDWSGQSPVAQARQIGLNRLREEVDRLENERARLLEEEAKAVESIPVIRRRLADIDQKIAALSSQR